MDALTLGLSLIIFVGLAWWHRREVARAYAAGQRDKRLEQQARTWHGLTVIGDEQRSVERNPSTNGATTNNCTTDTNTEQL